MARQGTMEAMGKHTSTNLRGFARLRLLALGGDGECVLVGVDPCLQVGAELPVVGLLHRGEQRLDLVQPVQERSARGEARSPHGNLRQHRSDHKREQANTGPMETPGGQARAVNEQ